jgi:hypothetical protein
MLEGVPPAWQYVILGVTALALTMVGLLLYNRREKRRKHALDLMKLMNRWGLEWFADLYEDYAVGDYSGIAVKVRQVVETVRSDEAMVHNLMEVTQKVAEYYVKNDPAKAAELMKILTPAPAVAPAVKS